MSEGQSRFNYIPLATYLCQVNGVSDVHLIDPFKNRVHAHTIPRKTALQLNFKTPPGTKWSEPQIACVVSTAALAKGKSPQPPEPFVHPKLQVPMPHDMNAVCVYNVTCRHYEMTSNIQDLLQQSNSNSTKEDQARLEEEQEKHKLVYGIRLNFLNDHMAVLQQTEEMRKMHAAAGAIKGAFAYFTPTPVGGKDINEIPMPELPFGYQNEQFTKTFMLIDESNFTNGVIPIPHQVCLAAGLPVWRGEPPDPDDRMLESMLKSMKITNEKERETKRQELITKFKEDFLESFKNDKKSTFFYAVPRRHVLAWGYHSETFMAQIDFKVEQFRFMHPTKKRSKLLYYLVPNAAFEDSIVHFKKAFLNKVDKKPLSSLGFEFVPVQTIKPEELKVDPSTVDVSIQLKAFFTYYSVPSLNADTIKHLAPTLCKDFPLCHNWSKDDVEAQIAIEQAQLEKEKKVPRATKKN